MVNPSFRSWARFRDVWATLPGYQRFEVLVAVVLRGVIAAIIVVALYRLIVAVIDTLVIQALNPLDHVVFQAVFGAIMTLLIALEFNHTLRYALPRGRTIIQARVLPEGAVGAAHRRSMSRRLRTRGVVFWRGAHNLGPWPSIATVATRAKSSPMRSKTYGELLTSSSSRCRGEACP